jgi:two-component system sensor histidine kinase TctE
MSWILVAILTIAMSAGIARDARRRRALNRALHEVRRPLQAVALALAADRGPTSRPRTSTLTEQIGLARAALAELDRAVNGGPPVPVPEPVSCRELAERAVERWRERADGAEVDLFWTAGPAIVRGERTRIAQALDNLIANALEHGTPPVRVGASSAPGRVRISVADSGPRPELGSSSNGNGRTGPRRGHGLQIASSAAAANGGRFFIFPSRRGTVAVLELPVEGAGPTLAA